MANFKEREGYIFDIKRFAVHDGPGIRTSIFLKGCPLKCAWCHNPEGIKQKISIWYNKNLCIACGKCVEVCPTNSLTLKGDKPPLIVIDRKTCDLSGKCIEVCPSKALSYTGYEAGVEGLMKEIEKDELFYSTSGGGITLTGGDPLFQPDFSLSLLKACKKKGYHTAIETCLYTTTKEIDKLFEYIDLFIVDIKLYNDLLHKKYTGQSNVRILENFKYLASKTTNIIVRIQMIPGYQSNTFLLIHILKTNT
jgi:pyruvate formate lyase activating enzyme